MTNGLGHARALARTGCHVIQLGGEVKPVTEAVVGATALSELSRFNFTKGFFGVNGISLKAGYTTPEINEAAVKTQAMHRCRSCYVLADSSKFDTTATLTFAPLAEATILTTVGYESVDVDSDVMVAQTVIVGRVPETYVNLGHLTTAEGWDQYGTETADRTADPGT